MPCYECKQCGEGVLFKDTEDAVLHAGETGHRIYPIQEVPKPVYLQLDPVTARIVWAGLMLLKLDSDSPSGLIHQLETGDRAHAAIAMAALQIICGVAVGENPGVSDPSEMVTRLEAVASTREQIRQLVITMLEQMPEMKEFHDRLPSLR